MKFLHKAADALDYLMVDHNTSTSLAVLAALAMSLVLGH